MTPRATTPSVVSKSTVPTRASAVPPRPPTPKGSPGVSTSTRPAPVSERTSGSPPRPVPASSTATHVAETLESTKGLRNDLESEKQGALALGPATHIEEIGPVLASRGHAGVASSSGQPLTSDIPAPPAFLGGELTADQAPGGGPVSSVRAVEASVQRDEVEQDGSLPTFGKQNKASRRRIWFGATGLAAGIGVLVIALRAPTPNGRDAAASASPVRAARSAVIADRVAREPAAPLAVEPASLPAPMASAAVASATATADPPAPTEEDEIKITINIKPDESLFSYKGKVLGRTPFILKHPRGEKRTYEVRKVGHKTTQVVVTGADKTIGFHLEQVVPHPDFL